MDALDQIRTDRLGGSEEPAPEHLDQIEIDLHETAGQRRALVALVEDNGNGESGRICELTAELLDEGGFTVDAALTVPREVDRIREAIETAVVGGADLVITIGGTGVGPRDVTPEATLDVLDMEVPGIAEALRNSGQVAGATEVLLSRGLSGISGSTVVVNLAGTRGAVRDGMSTLCPLVHLLLDELNTWEG
ncbi:MogA/MoaB family molybdenum cofactor biosynthesis protein [Corynebacterium ulceribovis]|uniref:MogA/MoaB family molybdenum cofactor biosynthesis protein n=1 Tax=Corynebacterium ulceribovis TaxID=487732 RepID=UPI000365E2B3|nr:MogA/MoaB family molybdenum cofactor biosynthesis protein [Corynebacterium ulceribovis]